MASDHVSTRAVGALLALSASAFIFVTTETLPIGLLLPISSELHTPQSAVGLLVTGYGLVVVIASVPLTRLTRALPRRRLLSALLVLFVLATLMSAVAPNYWVLLAARLVTALGQALFWSILIPTTAGLFPSRLRGRAIAVVFAGSSLAAVLGVPAGTWLGQQAGWRPAFLALSGVGVLVSVAVATLLPGFSPGSAPPARGLTPDARRYWSLMLVLTLAVGGSFTSFTYVTPFLADVSHVAPGAIGPMLLVRGLAGLVGVAVGGALVDLDLRTAVMVPITLQAVALLGLYGLGERPVVAVALIALSGLTFSAMSTALATQVLQVAPGSVDLAAAGASTAVNVGITAGAFLGSVLLPEAGVRSTALVAGLLSAAALGVVLGGPLRTSSAGSARVPDPAADPTSRSTVRA
jgi:DHA1 family inner membrane transport protein